MSLFSNIFFCIVLLLEHRNPDISSFIVHHHTSTNMFKLRPKPAAEQLCVAIDSNPLNRTRYCNAFKTPASIFSAQIANIHCPLHPLCNLSLCVVTLSLPARWSGVGCSLFHWSSCGTDDSLKGKRNH